YGFGSAALVGAVGIAIALSMKHGRAPATGGLRRTPRWFATASVSDHRHRTTHYPGIRTKGNSPMDRHSLPIVTHTPQPASAVDYRSQSRPFHRSAPVRPPQGAPNILVIMIDDVGFGAASAFGGPCRTPTAERLAQEGLGYTRFHTTALCSPTRAAMLTGRNHHSVGMGV